jgi:hypothetical protein
MAGVIDLKIYTSIVPAAASKINASIVAIGFNDFPEFGKSKGGGVGLSAALCPEL